MAEGLIFAVLFVLALFGAFAASKIYHARPRPFLYGEERFFLVADPGRNVLEGLYDNCGFQYPDGTPVTDERQIEELRRYCREFLSPRGDLNNSPADY